MTFIVPRSAAAQVDNFDCKFRGFFTSARFVEWQEQAAIRRLPGPHRFAGQGRTPEHGAGRQADLKEVALVVSNGVARLDERFPFVADQNLIAGLGDVGHQHRLRRVARHVQTERARQFGVASAKTERRERWRLATRNHFAEVRGIRAVEAFGFEILDFPGAKDFDGDAASFALGVEKTQHWNINLPFARAAGFAGHNEARVLFDRFQEGDGEFVGLHFPIGYHCAENLIDRDLLGDLNSCDARRALSYLQIYFGVDGSRVFAEPQELRQRSAHSQRLSGAVVLGLPAPSEGKCFVSAPVSNPLAFRTGFGFLREETPGEPDIHALPR